MGKKKKPEIMQPCKLSKREFLKLMGGASLGLLPFASCFNRDEESKKTKKTSSKEPYKTDDKTQEYKVTNSDVILLQRDNAEFEKYNQSYNKRVHLIPKYIAVCLTEMGVQYAIQKAKQENLPIAIKSGGHSFEGFSSNNDGMVINVSRMKKLTWNDDGTVSVQPGVLLRELHEEVYAKGKLIPAGSCGGVGIAGLTLGGGYGFFSRKYGLTCDSLEDATMINANEKIIKANEDKDLIWALKGGGNGNFGVVTDLKFKTYPLPKTFTSYTAKHTINDAASFQTILEKWMNAVAQLPNEGFAAFVQNGKTLTMLFTSYGEVDIASVANKFSEGSRSFSSSLSKPLVPSLKRFYGRKEPLFFKNASCGYFKSYTDLNSIAAEIFEQVIKQPGIIFQVNTLGGAINQNEFEQASCYPHRNFDFLGELQGYYDNKSQEENILNSFSNIQKLIAEAGVKAHYRNYPDINFKDWQNAYYGDNYAKLQQLKAKYDSENVFRYPQTIEVGNV